MGGNSYRAQKLEGCNCTTPAISAQTFKSINDALQQISAIYENYRASRGGKVYDYVYFFDKDEVWKPLEIWRDVVYRPHAVEIEKWLRQYVKPHYNDEAYYEVLLRNKDELIELLRTRNNDLNDQVRKIDELLRKSKIAVYREALNEFQDRLTKDIPETKGDDCWQRWIYKNHWLFGAHYRIPIEKEQVGFGSIPDYLFPTLDGFVDFIEIKRPKHKVIEPSKSHSGAYRWSREAIEAIGQSVQYLAEIEKNQYQIAERIEAKQGFRLNTIKPRAMILIGNSDSWSAEERKALRKLNHSLHAIEILTYTDLFLRGESLVRLFEENES